MKHEMPPEERLATRKCPQCGKRFTIRCEPREWGWVYHGTSGTPSGGRQLLCSGECSSAYAREQLRRDSEKLSKTKAWRVFCKVVCDGQTVPQAALSEGVTKNTAQSMMDNITFFHYREVKYLTGRAV